MDKTGGNIGRLVRVCGYRSRGRLRLLPIERNRRFVSRDRAPLLLPRLLLLRLGVEC